MKWQTKAKALPKPGDIRIRVVFAWIPESCRDGHTRWLERVQLTEKYRDEFFKWVILWVDGLEGYHSES